MSAVCSVLYIRPSSKERVFFPSFFIHDAATVTMTATAKKRLFFFFFFFILPLVSTPPVRFSSSRRMHTIVPSNPPQTGGGMELASLPPPAAAAAPWRRRRRIENTLFIASYHTSLRSICCLLFQVCTTYIGSNRWVSIHSSIEHSLWVSTVWVAATKARNNGIRGERQLWERIWERGVFFVSLFSFCCFWWFWCEAIGRTDARWENYSLTRFVVQYVVVVFYFFAGEPKIPPKQHTHDFVVSLCFYSLVLASLFFSWICAAWSGENSSSRSDGGGSVKWWKKNEWGMDGGAEGGIWCRLLPLNQHGNKLSSARPKKKRARAMRSGTTALGTTARCRSLS